MRLPLAPLLFCAVCACASGDHPNGWPDQAAGITPAAWSVNMPQNVDVNSHATSQLGWWERFDDSTLTDLIDRAMKANATIAESAAALREARALRDVAAASLWPALDGSASARRESVGLKEGGRSRSNSFQAALDANWTLDVFGANRASVSGADANAWASAADLGDAQVQIAAEVGVNYILLRSAQARLTIAQGNLASQLDTLQITQWREQAGLASAIETQQALASAAQTRAALPPLQTTIDQTMHALAVLAGEPPAALLAALSKPRPIPHASEEIAFRLPAETLRQRADVRAAEYRIAAAFAAVRQSRAARLPNFSIGGSLGLSALTWAALTDGASVVSSLLAGVTLPIFDAGAGRGRVNARDAALAQAEQFYRGRVLGALLDVEDALAALRDDRVRLESLRDAASSATTAATLARQQYTSGLVDFQVVLETQRTQLSAQDGLITGEGAVSADTIRLYKALGGGWRPESLIAYRQVSR